MYVFHQLASIFGVNIKLMLKGQIVCTKHLLPPDLFYNLHFFTHNYVPIYKKHIYLGFGNFCTWWVFSNFFLWKFTHRNKLVLCINAMAQNSFAKKYTIFLNFCLIQFNRINSVFCEVDILTEHSYNHYQNCC